MTKNASYITVVSGLPRSGTSMMMNMLNVGGLSLMTDDIRKADENNPKGYYEFEKIKELAKESAWLTEAQGKAIKAISMLLYELPADFTYKIIFMKRKMAEILSSQKKMLERMGNPETQNKDEALRLKFEIHLRKIIRWLDEQQHMAVLYVNYKDVIEHPLEQAGQIIQFLDAPLDPDAMARVVDPSLYRQKKAMN